MWYSGLLGVTLVARIIRVARAAQVARIVRVERSLPLFNTAGASRVPAPSMYKTMDGFSTKLVTIFV